MDTSDSDLEPLSLASPSGEPPKPRSSSSKTSKDNEGKMEFKILKEEEIKSEIFVIEGIKCEDEETGFEEEDFCSEENVDCDGSHLSAFSEENIEGRPRIPDTDSVNIEADCDYVEHTGCESSSNGEVNSKNNLRKRTGNEGENWPSERTGNEGENWPSEFSCRGKDYASNHRKSFRVRTYQCNDCECFFDKQYQLVNHAASIHGKEKPFKCAECDYSCSVKGDLTKHIRSVHRKEKIFNCTECDFSSSRKEHLTTHIKSVHRKEKPFKCTECDYYCSRKRDLTRHIIAVHLKIKPFNCTECDYSVSRKEQLTNHIKFVHRKEEKPFKCTDCDYSCSWKRDLTRHIAVHRKIKPLNCIEP